MLIFCDNFEVESASHPTFLLKGGAESLDILNVKNERKIKSSIGLKIFRK